MMAYFCRLYISSGALTLDSMLFDLFGLKVLISYFSPPFKSSVCMCKPSCASQPHLCVPSPEGRSSPVVMEMGHRCSTGSLDACDVIMEQEKEIVLLQIYPGLLNLAHNIVMTQNFTSAHF